MLTALLALSLAAPASADPACLLDVLGPGSFSMTEPLGRTLLAAGVLPTHVGPLASPHARSELFHGPGCAAQARALAARLLLPPDAVKPRTWLSRYGLTLAVSGVESKRLAEAVASKDLARIRAAARPLADGSVLLRAVLEQDDPDLSRLILQAGVFVDGGTCASLAAAGKARALKVFAQRLPLCATSGALADAAAEGQVEAVRVLLDAGVPAGAAGQERCPLCVARTPEVASLLLARGARCDELLPGGATPLHKNPNPAVLEFLLSKGARVDARDGAGWTPLHHAALAGDAARVKLLLARGADPMARTGLVRGRPPGDGAPAANSPVGRTPLDLVRGGADENNDDSEARTPAEEAIVAAGGKEGAGAHGSCRQKVARAAFAARGEAFALHWWCEDDPGDKVACGYPPVSGKQNFGDAIAFCTGTQGCDTTVELHATEWLPAEEKMRCMAQGAMRAAQALADAELAARGLTFAPPLACDEKAGYLRCRLPAGMLERYGIDGQVWATYGGGDPGDVREDDDSGAYLSIGLVGVEADGIGRAELDRRECTEMCSGPQYEYGGAFAPPDGHLLVTGFENAMTSYTSQSLAIRLLDVRAQKRLAKADAAGALEDAERALKLDPSGSAAAYVGARAAARLGQAEKALGLLERLARHGALPFSAAREGDFASLRTQPRFLQVVRLQ